MNTEKMDLLEGMVSNLLVNQEWLIRNLLSEDDGRRISLERVRECYRMMMRLEELAELEGQEPVE